MSKSNASAKNRRAFGGNPPPPVPSSMPSSSVPVPYQQPNGQSQGFTLQQVIAVIDNRLLNLEKFMTESKEGGHKHVHFEQTQTVQNHAPPVDSSVNEILNEFSARFDMIVEEVATLKDIVLKLQTYTMDVNKTLLEERINILSDLGNNNNQTFNISNDPSEESNEIIKENIISEITLETA
jgi:hypothetical protein